MADFCKQCTEKLFGKEAANSLNAGIRQDEFIEILCEGCGRVVRIKNDGYRIECNTCLYGHEGVCENCAGVEGYTTEIVGGGICLNFRRRND